MAGKQAITIDINEYKHAIPLDGCVEDAFRISELLKHNWNGRKNMDVQLFTSEDTDKVGARKLLVEMGKMFRNNLELAVLYFENT